MKNLLIILFLVVTQANAATYYVKGAGGTGTGVDDANAWSYAKLNSTTLSSGDVVYFKRGETFFGFLQTTSGVTYDAYGTGAQPIISGFTNLTSWTNLGSNKWSTTLTGGSTMITVGGTLTPPGRFPNTGWLPMDVPDTNSQGQKIGSTIRFFTSTPSPSTYNGGSAVIWKREWIIDKCPITSVSGTTVNFANPTPFPAMDGWGFFFTDHVATLDLQNEWAYSSNTLTMYSTVDPSTLNVKAAIVDSLVKMGSKSNITFQNLMFEGTKQSTFLISGGSNNKINNCTIRFSGKRAIEADFMTDFSMTNCDVRNINWSGVDAILGTRQYFADNVIEYCGLNPALCQPGNKANHGLWANGINGVIERNKVGYIGYVGIDMAGNYDTARYNYVHDFTQMVTDGGGIYLSDESNGVGRMIYGNTVVYGKGERSGTPFPGYENSQGIYLDEATGGVEVLNNFSGFNAGGGLYLHRAHDIIVRGNTFYGNTIRQAYFGEDSEGEQRIVNVDFTNNILHSLNSGDYHYAFRATPTISTFFSRIGDNILSKPSGTDSSVYGLQISIVGGNPVYDQPSYTLAGWKSAYPGYDYRTTGTPTAFATGTPVVQFNPSGTATGFANNGIFKSITGTVYSIGRSFVKPYGYEVINKTQELVVPSTAPVTSNRFR